MLCPPAYAESECVVLLHGLARVSNSMSELSRKLERANYDVVSINYPSRRHSIDVLAADAVGRGVASCRLLHAPQISFVTHSLGGILLRYYLVDNEIAELNKVVMLGPPNQGSELVDGLLPVPGFKFFGGPTGIALGTDDAGIVASLGAVNFDLGVIAGTTNINPLARLFIPGPNDSIVSVESTKVEGMRDHIILPVTHTFMMRNNQVIDEVIHYLKTGAFIPQEAKP
ncbi:MAG: alpha/beta hydrolase [SAR86 cluster bacterium]|uniref:Alpha/beta hydrolase n=1 Tax=SAR86 cluster bacterium TaxID=2030880 RepID=A0A2A5B3E0_9GAMM|nr:MAG: alpha/beta hydrolase [SAR86 cluster bacterium]